MNTIQEVSNESGSLNNFNHNMEAFNKQANHLPRTTPENPAIYSTALKLAPSSKSSTIKISSKTADGAFRMNTPASPHYVTRTDTKKSVSPMGKHTSMRSNVSYRPKSPTLSIDDEGADMDVSRELLQARAREDIKSLRSFKDDDFDDHKSMKSYKGVEVNPITGKDMFVYKNSRTKLSKKKRDDEKDKYLQTASDEMRKKLLSQQFQKILESDGAKKPASSHENFLKNKQRNDFQALRTNNIMPGPEELSETESRNSMPGGANFFSQQPKATPSNAASPSPIPPQQRVPGSTPGANNAQSGPEFNANTAAAAAGSFPGLFGGNFGSNTPKMPSTQLPNNFDPNSMNDFMKFFQAYQASLNKQSAVNTPQPQPQTQQPQTNFGMPAPQQFPGTMPGTTANNAAAGGIPGSQIPGAPPFPMFPDTRSLQEWYQQAVLFQAELNRQKQEYEKQKREYEEQQKMMKMKQERENSEKEKLLITAVATAKIQSKLQDRFEKELVHLVRLRKQEQEDRYNRYGKNFWGIAYGPNAPGKSEKGAITDGKEAGKEPAKKAAGKQKSDDAPKKEASVKVYIEDSDSDLPISLPASEVRTSKQFLQALISAYPEHKKAFETGRYKLVDKANNTIFLPKYYEMTLKENPSLEIVIRFEKSLNTYTMPAAIEEFKYGSKGKAVQRRPAKSSTFLNWVLEQPTTAKGTKNKRPYAYKDSKAGGGEGGNRGKITEVNDDDELFKSANIDPDEIIS